MVLVPEVASAVEAVGANTPILAAGGIVTGRQMAAAMAMGAHGAWCGSVWLTTAEAETNPVVKEKMLAARSEEHTSELQSLMRTSYAVLCLKKKQNDST